MIYDLDHRVMSPQILSGFKDRDSNGERGGPGRENGGIRQSIYWGRKRALPWQRQKVQHKQVLEDETGRVGWGKTVRDSLC